MWTTFGFDLTRCQLRVIIWLSAHYRWMPFAGGENRDDRGIDGAPFCAWSTKINFNISSSAWSASSNSIALSSRFSSAKLVTFQWILSNLDDPVARCLRTESYLRKIWCTQLIHWAPAHMEIIEYHNSQSVALPEHISFHSDALVFPTINPPTDDWQLISDFSHKFVWTNLFADSSPICMHL